MNKESLKNKLQLLEQSDSLLKKRHQLYQEMESVVQSINRQSILHHKEGKKNDMRTHDIQEERKKLFRLKEEIKKMDHTLDQIKEDEEKGHDDILAHLVQETLYLFPESNVEYQKLADSYLHQNQTLHSFETIEPYLKKYYQHFQKGASLLMQGNRKSLFALLFGRHPKVLLAYEIDSLSKEARKDLKVLETLPTNLLKTNLISLLKEMVIESDKKWNKALYEKSFLSFYQRMKELYDEMETMKKRKVDAIKEHHNQTMLWMKKWIS